MPFKKALQSAVMLAAAAAATAFGQDFPIKPITVIMPYSAGGPGDTLARLVAMTKSRRHFQAVAH